ncbi:MAG TPA: DUF1326 domain-containing protein [Burkholderiales bacterium]|nr:DUF1326 domain-containing protein [Burkholderiales bacterium]
MSPRAGGSRWSIRGSYYESCNCQAVCPCRRLNGKPGGDSTYGICQFLLSWHIERGEADGVDLAGRQVVMAGFYRDAEPGKPWSIKLYIDAQAAPEALRQLERIFLGRAGGNMPFTGDIVTLLEVGRAEISLVHQAGRQTIRVGQLGASAVARRADYEGSVSCGIPGHDHPGTEYVASLAMHDGPLQWDYEERCGFATDFRFYG